MSIDFRGIANGSFTSTKDSIKAKAASGGGEIFGIYELNFDLEFDFQSSDNRVRNKALIIELRRVLEVSRTKSKNLENFILSELQFGNLNKFNSSAFGLEFLMIERAGGGGASAILGRWTIDHASIVQLKSEYDNNEPIEYCKICLLYTSPSPRDKRQSRMPSSA